jgi:hypothetical protein
MEGSRLGRYPVEVAVSTCTQVMYKWKRSDFIVWRPFLARSILCDCAVYPVSAVVPKLQAAGATGPCDHTYLNLGTLYCYGRSVQARSF